MALSAWSSTAANNNSAPPNGAPEGWAPSSVNNTIRQLMADVKSGVFTLVDTLSDLKAVSTRSNNDFFYTRGRTTANDGGGAPYYFDSASASTANDVTIIAPNSGTGRFKLIHDGSIDARVGGCKGDDSTNNKTAIDAITGASGIYCVVFKAGTYQIEATTRYTDSVSSQSIPAGVRCYSNQRIVIEAGATLKYPTWAGAGAGNDDSGAMVAAYSVSNVIIEGKGVIEGNFTAGGSYPSRNNSSQHGIHIGNSTDVTIKDLSIKKCWGDGWTVSYIANTSSCDNSKRVNIINVRANLNRRNNCSMVGCEGFSIIGGSYTDVPSVANGGVSPWCGIDLEPNDGANSLANSNFSRVTNGTIVGVYTSGNPFRGISVGIGNTTADLNECNFISISGCSFADGTVIQKSKSITLVGCDISCPQNDPSDGSGLAGLHVLDSDSCVLSMNAIFDVSGHGIWLDLVNLTNCDKHIVVGNQIEKIGRKTDATFNGINVDGAHNLIALNFIRRFGSGNEPLYGIRMTADSNDCDVLFNSTKGLRTGSGKGWLDSGSNNTIIGLGTTSTKKIYINTTEDATPSTTVQGIMIDGPTITMAYTGGGAAVLFTFIDGAGTAGKIEVDGSQHCRYYVTPTVFHTGGSGTPEGNVTAPIGSLYSRSDGGAGTSLYVKESGSGNTGWAAK